MRTRQHTPCYSVVIPVGFRRARVVSLHATIEDAESDLAQRSKGPQGPGGMFVMQGCTGRSVGEEIDVVYN